MVRVGVVGTTSWGTTLAVLLASNGADVVLLSRTVSEAKLLRRVGENQRLLPGVKIPSSVTITADPEYTLRNADMVVFAVPSHSLRQNASTVAPILNPNTLVLSAVKGLEKDTGLRMSQVLEEELVTLPKGRLAVLSGPNLSREICEGKPSMTAVAAHDYNVARQIQELFNSSTFRVYTNADVVGVELGGTLKNIIAIGSGVIDGLGYGVNAKAAFVTRGLAEITRLGVAVGAKRLTFTGLAGFGDLMATCFSTLSRNRYVGERLGKGDSLEDVLSSMPHVAEGVDTTRAVLILAERYQVEMPITQVTAKILFGGLTPKQAESELLYRAPGPEWPPEAVD